MKDSPKMEIMKRKRNISPDRNNESAAFPASPFYRFGLLRQKNAFLRDSGESRSSGDSEITRGGFHYFCPKNVLFPFHYFHFAGNLSFFHFLPFLSFPPFSFFHFSFSPDPPGADPVDPLDRRTPGTPMDGPRGPLGRTDPGPDIQE